MHRTELFMSRVKRGHRVPSLTNPLLLRYQYRVAEPRMMPFWLYVLCQAVAIFSARTQQHKTTD